MGHKIKLEILAQKKTPLDGGGRQKAEPRVGGLRVGRSDQRGARRDGGAAGQRGEPSNQTFS